jgi:hypothetical protein
MDDPDCTELPASDLTWEPASRPLSAAIVDRHGGVYLRVLKLDHAPVLPSSTPVQQRASADYILLRLIAALSADTTDVQVATKAETGTRRSPLEDRASELRVAIQEIHAKASSIAKEGHLLQLGVDDASMGSMPLDADGISDRPFGLSMQAPFKERKKRISILFEPLLQLFHGLSAEDIEIDEECTVRAPLRGLKHRIPENLPRGEQLDRLDAMIEMLMREWNKGGNRFTVGGRPDIYDGWIRMEFPDAGADEEADNESGQSDRQG